MYTTFMQAIIIASGGIVSVGSILIVILLLISKQGFYNGLAYVIGYVGGYTSIGLFSLSFGKIITTNSNKTSSTGSIISVMLGILFLLLALRNWRKKAANKPSLPKFFSTLDQLKPSKSFAFGVFVSFMNFKNLAIYLSAISVIALSNLPQIESLILLSGVISVFCSTVILPLIIYLVMPNQANYVLKTIKNWLEKNSRPLSIGALFVFGCIFLIRGLNNWL